MDALDLAALGALIGDPARARMLTALMSGTALTATELAVEAEVAPSTASTHLAKLTDARLLSIARQGRHRYFRIAGAEIAEMLEKLMELTSRQPSRQRGPADPSLRLARVCYDHLAGELGVRMFDALTSRGVLTGRDAPVVSPDGREFLAHFGVDLDPLESARRPLCRTCLDWSERRHHLAGSLGAAILQRIFALRWARRDLASRAVLFSASGEQMFRAQFL